MVYYTCTLQKAKKKKEKKRRGLALHAHTSIRHKIFNLKECNIAIMLHIQEINGTTVRSTKNSDLFKA